MSPAEPAMHGDSPLPAPDARRTPEGERIVILNVDDYPPGRYATSRVLRQAGFQVVEAGTGGQALSLAAAEVPDLIVLDVNLPDVDGFEVCARLKEAPATAGIPILYLSALYHDTEHRVRGLNVGADAYLKQPVEPPELVATVNALLRARHVEAAVRDSEQRFRSLIEGTSQVLWTAAPDGSLAVPQPSWEAFTGQPADEQLGWGWLDAVHPEDRARARRLWRELEAVPATLEMELRIRRRDGAWRDVVSRGVPLLDPAGRVSEWIGTHTDVTERRQAERERDQATREAQRARSEAEEANRAKSAFLANMSHEIRTPINAIIGYTELMEMGIAGPLTQVQQEHLGRVRVSSRHLLGLVNEVLDLAKIESGQLTVETATTRVADSVAAALALVEPLVGQAGLTLENGVTDACELSYRGDPDRVRQILVNLLSNAVKFTAPGGQLHVSCGVAGQEEADAAGAQVSGEGPWACIQVEDTGRGIAPDQVEAVFSPFVQGESGHTRTVGGTGLGLTISRHLSRLMQGDLTVESRVDQGSKFTLWLPLARAPGSEPEPSRR